MKDRQSIYSAGTSPPALSLATMEEASYNGEVEVILAREYPMLKGMKLLSSLVVTPMIMQLTLPLQA